jgi:hypothetical protein
MARNGVAFKAQRVYDLPLNGEVQVFKHPMSENYDFGSLGFECQVKLTTNAPTKVVKEVFKPAAVHTDVLVLIMS